jgi:hypothetical protein
MKFIFSEVRTREMSKDILTATEVIARLERNDPDMTEIETFPGRTKQWGSTREEHEKNFKAMMAALSKNTVVRVLSFRSEALSEENNELIAEVLLTNTSIVEVNTYQCGKKGAEAFMQMLAANKTLKSLRLGTHSWSNEPGIPFDSYKKLLSGLESEKGNRTLTCFFAFMGDVQDDSLTQETRSLIFELDKRRQKVIERNKGK